jgi:hypothetical protein
VIDITSKFYEYAVCALIDAQYAYLYEETDLGFTIRTEKSEHWVTCDPFASSYEGECQRQTLLEYFSIGIHSYTDEEETWWENGLDFQAYYSRRDAEDSAIIAACILSNLELVPERNRNKIYLV